MSALNGLLLYCQLRGEENTSEEYSAVADYKAVVPWRLAGQDVLNKSPVST